MVIMRHALSLAIVKERIDSPYFYQTASQFLSDIRLVFSCCTRLDNVCIVFLSLLSPLQNIEVPSIIELESVFEPLVALMPGSTLRNKEEE